MKLDHSLTPFTKMNLKCIKGRKHKTIKLLEENIGKNLLDTSLGIDFLDITPKAQFIKEKQSKSPPPPKKKNPTPNQTKTHMRLKSLWSSQRGSVVNESD